MKIFQHFWGLLEVDINHLLGNILAEQGIHEIGLGSLRTVLSTHLFRVVAVRYPNTTTRGRTGTSDLVLFLDDQYVLGTHLPVTHCRGQSTVTGTHH